jgi:two-component system, NarL family, sensor kinase
LENYNEVNIKLFIIAGTMGMLLLVLFIFLLILLYNKRMLHHQQSVKEKEISYQKSLLQSTLLAEEKERERISKNLHDDMGTLLSLLHMNVTRLKVHAENLQGVQVIIDDQSKMLSDTTAVFRSVTRDLASPSLLKFGYILGVKDLVQVINQNTSILVDFESQNENFRFNQSDEIQLFRVTKELLNNILKHAKPKHIKIFIIIVNHQLTLLLKHDGEGIDNERYETLKEESKGLGLKSLESRLQNLSGTLLFEKNSPSQYTITCKIELKDGKNY